jgi:hypothetical protein
MNKKKYSSEKSDNSEVPTESENITESEKVHRVRKVISCTEEDETDEPKVIKIEKLKKKKKHLTKNKKTDDKKILEMLHDLVSYNEEDEHIKKTYRPGCRQSGLKKYSAEVPDEDRAKIVNNVEEKTKATQARLKKFKTIVEREQTKEIIGSIGENVIAPIQNIFLDMLRANGPGVILNGVMPLVSDRLRIAMEESRDKRYLKMIQKHDGEDANIGTKAKLHTNSRVNMSKHKKPIQRGGKQYYSSEDQEEIEERQDRHRERRQKETEDESSQSPKKNKPQIDIQNPTYVQNLVNLLQQQQQQQQQQQPSVQSQVSTQPYQNNNVNKKVVTATLSSGSRKIFV